MRAVRSAVETQDLRRRADSHFDVISHLLFKPCLQYCEGLRVTTCLTHGDPGHFTPMYTVAYSLCRA